MKIIVSSQNPVKINAIEYAFTACFPDDHIEIMSVNVPSNVGDQPMTEIETLTGAQNRVENAKQEFPDADYWAGIEGGLEERNGKMECFAWVYISAKSGKIGKGRTGTFFLPQKMADLVRSGMELGDADDVVFNITNSKQKQGTIGTLTRNIVDRTGLYKDAVVFALIPFMNPELY